MIFKNFLKCTIIGVATLSILGINANAFAAGNCAFSAGKGYDNVDMSSTTINASAVYRKMGYNSYYATDGATKSILAGYFQNGIRRLESDIVFLTGHGGSNYIDTAAAGGLRVDSHSISKYVGTNEINWSNVKLAIFLACNTGNGSNNLAYDVFKKSGWTTITMGWKQSILNVDADKWINNFNSKLASGGTVDQALDYAGSKSYSNPSIKDLSFFGEASSTFKHSNISVMESNSLKDDIDESNITYFNSPLYKYDGKGTNLDNIVEAIKTLNPSFNINDYEVNVYDIKNNGTYYTIEFTYKIGEFFTNSSYTVVVKNGYVTQIADNSVSNSNSISNNSMASKESNIEKISDLKVADLIKIKNIAKKQITEKDTEIKGQKTRLYWDLKSNKKYVQVDTQYGFKNSEAYSEFSYLYEI